jgi:predicted nucleic acid-binding protein
MKPNVLVDTGPLVAFLSQRDTYHEWIAEQMADVMYPVLTCEAVISEACFLLARYQKNNAYILLEMVEQGLITLPFHFEENAAPIRELMMKYANVPMSFADACLVRMAELYNESYLVTLDGDFRIYRKHGRQLIRTIMPEHL